MKLVADLMVWATFAGALVFVLVYLGRNWRTTAVGRNVMVFMMVIMIVSGLAVSTLLFGREWPYRDFIRAAAWGMVAAVIWWRNLLLIGTPRRRNDAGEDNTPPMGGTRQHSPTGGDRD